MSDSALHIELAKEFYTGIGTIDIDRACSLVAEDVDAVFPYSLAPHRRALIKGRDSLHARLSRTVPAVARSIDFFYDDFICGDDGNTLVMQFHSRGVRATGGPYENQYVTIMRFKDGKISYLAEHFDVVRGAGGADALCAAIKPVSAA